MAPQGKEPEAITQEELEQAIRELEEVVSGRSPTGASVTRAPEWEPVQNIRGHSAHSGYRFNDVGQFGFSGFDSAQDKRIKELEKKIEKLQEQMKLISAEVVSGLSGHVRQDILRKALEEIEESKVKRPKPKRRIEVENSD